MFLKERKMIIENLNLLETMPKTFPYYHPYSLVENNFHENAKGKPFFRLEIFFQRKFLTIKYFHEEYVNRTKCFHLFLSHICFTMVQF